VKFTDEQRSIWTDAYGFCQKWNGMKCEDEEILEMTREYCAIVDKHREDRLAFCLMSGVLDWLDENLKEQAMAKLEAEMQMESAVNEPEPEQVTLDF
jgi:hypothetical protein